MVRKKIVSATKKKAEKKPKKKTKKKLAKKKLTPKKKLSGEELRLHRIKNLNMWKPGQSGNPSGLPKAGTTLRDMARAHTQEALETLIASLRSRSQGVRVKAACEILDRGWGKPTQKIAGDEESGPIKLVTVQFIDPHK